jgi:UDP-glucuronate decarboxylase
MARIKRILVAGGAGFLGSHLCELLIEQGHDVICVDNFFTSQKSNVSHLLPRPNFELIRHDVTIPLVLEVDEIYNLACPAAPRQYNPMKTIKTSVLGAINLLELARECRAKILQASTSEIYGDPEVHPQKEDYRGSVNTIGPRACYDEGKRAAETLFMAAKEMYKTEVRLARIFNTYGPRTHPFDGRVVPNFILQALADEPITIYGDGSQTRSFCYYTDLIDGLVRLMENEKNFIGPVNLGNPNEFTIKELADLVWELLGKEPKYVFKELPPDDPYKRQPDISLAKEKLNWEPKIQLREGLTKMIEWFKTINLDDYRAPTPNY